MKNKKSKKRKVIITLIVAIILILIFLWATRTISNLTGKAIDLLRLFK